MATKTKRRGNGEGSIFQREDGRWTGSISLGYDASGKRKRRTVYGKTKRDCQTKLTRLQNQKLDGMITEVSNLTVKDFLTRWLEDWVRPNCKYETYCNCETSARVHLIPQIGRIPISKLTPAHIQGMLSDMERNGSSPSLRKITHSILRRALNKALKWNMIPRNVCFSVDTPRAVTKEIRPLTAKQARTLLYHAQGERFEAIYVLALTTGMRQGEILGLQWENVDLDAGTLSVRHTLSRSKNKLELTKPKTPKSIRLIDLPALAVDALRSHRRLTMIEGRAGESIVFLSRDGALVNRRNHLNAQSFKPLLKKAGLPDIRFHDLRHTAATLMLKEGVHPKVVQERLGHSNISITLDIYSHVIPSMQKEASDKIDTLLSIG